MRWPWLLPIGLVGSALSVGPALASESPTPLQFNRTDTPPPQPVPVQPAPPPPQQIRTPPPDTRNTQPRTASRSLFYEVRPGRDTHGHTKVYLLGSVHVGTEATYPLSSILERSFQNASTLVVEVNARPQDANRLVAAGTFPTGSPQSLRQVVPPSCYEAAKDLAPDLGLQMYKLNQMKPWFAAMSIEMLEASMAGLKPELGIDLHFLKEAKSSKKIVELESVDQQIDMFRDLPKEQSSALLCSAVGEARHFKADMTKLFRAWHSSDASGVAALIDEEANASPEGRAALGTLLTSRNKAMTEKIAAFMDPADPDIYFVVVGAGHLVGSEGIVQLLQDKGFTVEQK
jgi:uncharacterized protein YbaP (TraB family)